MGRVAGPREEWGELLKYESDTAIGSAHVQSYLRGCVCVWGGGFHSNSIHPESQN